MQYANERRNPSLGGVGGAGSLSLPASEVPLVLGISGARSDEMFVVRESDEWDLLLFDAMREQTYQPYRTLQAIEAVRALGLLPLTCAGSMTVTEVLADGSVTEQTVIVETLRKGRTRAVLFCYGGVWHLWSRASAASMNGEGVNEFTALLVEVIKRLRPMNLRAANFARLIRSQDQGALLLHEMSGNVDSVWAGNIEFHMTGPSANVGKMMFSMFAMVASMERDWIVQRLQTGRIAKWRRDEWPYGAGTVPYGYRYDEASRQLVVVEELRGQVREMLVVLAGTGSPQAMHDQLAKIGMVSMRRHRRLGSQLPVGALKHSSALINSIYSWVPVWCHGEYLFRLANVFPGVEEIAGVVVTRAEGMRGDMGELQMLCHVPLPDGGWAEPELLAAVEDAAIRHTVALKQQGRNGVRPLSPAVEQATRAKGMLSQLLNPDRARGNDPESRNRRADARGRRQITPLTGRSWSDSPWVYELRALGSREGYQLWRWPAGGSPEEAVMNPTGDRAANDAESNLGDGQVSA